MITLSKTLLYKISLYGNLSTAHVTKQYFNIVSYTIANITFLQLHYKMSPIQMSPEINCTVSYFMYDIYNLIICIDKFHIRQVTTPTDQMNAK